MLLGNLNLRKKIGQGGMATVWLAEHQRDTSTFAVKMMHAAFINDDTATQRFLAEARAISQLDHSGIVKIYDYGLISSIEATQRDSELFPIGLPYCVMQYHPQGTYKSPAIVNDWSSLKRELLLIMEAITLVHAHGIVHCDLKPSNILRGESGPIISDFGIIHHLNPQNIDYHLTPAKQTLSGTPSYMSPEQIRTETDSFGPWTDLYAIACITYFLATGRPPYNAPLAMTRMLQHLQDPLPSLSPLFPVPAALEGWIHWCMSKNPNQRPRFTYEALEAFQTLGEAHRTAPVVLGNRALPLMSGSSPKSLLEKRPEYTVDQMDRVSERALMTLIDEESRISHISQGQVQYHSRMERSYYFGTEAILRFTPPFVGRGELLSELHSELNLARSGESRFVLLIGEEGIGKSTLINQFLIDVHRRAKAETLKINHESSLGDFSGIPGMLNALWSSYGQTREQLHSRLSSRSLRRFKVEETDIQSMISWVSPPSTEADYARKSARLAALTRWITQRCHDYPQLIVIDDAQGAIESLSWVDDLLTNHPYLPLLVIAVTHDRREVINKLPSYPQLAREKRGLERVVISLNPKESYHLFDAFFPLESSLKEKLYIQCQGHPRLSLQRMRYWLDSGALRMNQANQWTWDPSETSHQHNQVLYVLDSRISSQKKTMRSLEIAALIGHSFSVKLWLNVCNEAELTLAKEGLSSLLSAGVLSMIDEEHLSFIYKEEHQALIQQARATDRAPRWHTLIAQSLDAYHDYHPAERLRHWSQTSSHTRVIEVAQELIQYAKRLDQYELMNEGFSWWIKGLRQHQIKRDSAEWRSLKLSWSERCLLLGFNDQARRHAQDIIESLRDHPPSVTLCQSLLLCAQAQKWDLKRSESTLLIATEACQIATSIPDSQLLIECLDRLAVYHHTYGRLDESYHYFHEALQLFNDAISIKLQAMVHLGIARLCLERDLLAEANEHCVYALGMLKRDEYGALKGSILLTAGDISRQRNFAQEALAYYDQAAHLLLSLGAPEVWAAYLNLALTAYDHEDWESAAQMISNSRDVALKVTTREVVSMINSCSLFGLAKRREWSDFDMILTTLLNSDDHRYAQYDSANTLERLAHSLNEEGEALRAHEVWRLTAYQFRALGLIERALIAESFQV